MARAEFEEKEYEIAFTIELAADRGIVFSSGQVLEKVVGYDVASDPSPNHLIWELLQVPRPKGLRLVQPLWNPGALPPADRLPRQPVSLLLQYKRPDFLIGPAAAQWRLWDGPYYRFSRTKHQHDVLRRLQRRLGEQALVRYAAPAFSYRAELEYRHLRRTVIAGSGFVSPTRLGRHRVWTYRHPGTNGRPNPRGAAFLFEGFDDLQSAWRGAVERIQRAEVERADRAGDLVPYDPNPFGSHIAALGEAARDRNPAIREKVSQWEKRVRHEDVPIDSQTLARVADIAAITTLMTQLNGTWHIVGDLPDG